MVTKSSNVKLKNGVDFSALRPIMQLYANMIADLHFHNFGKPLVITSTTEGKHSVNSLHYKGLAIDVRRWDKLPSEVNSFLKILKFEFDKNLDIVLEKTHFHIEYDPK